MSRQARQLVPLLGAILIALPSAQARAGSADAAAASVRFLPIKRLTPGQRGPRVTPSNIHSTVCVGEYSDTQRPRSSLTKRMEREAAVKYGIGTSTRTTSRVTT